ncbi:hypothetical protein Tco_0200899 [Tanacetum coccineum]
MVPPFAQGTSSENNVGDRCFPISLCRTKRGGLKATYPDAILAPVLKVVLDLDIWTLIKQITFIPIMAKEVKRGNRNSAIFLTSGVGAQGRSSNGRIMAAKWGEYTRRIGVDEFSIKICHYDEPECIDARVEEKTFYTEEDLQEFLNQCRYLAPAPAHAQYQLEKKKEIGSSSLRQKIRMKLRRKFSTRNLFVGNSVLKRTIEFCIELKRLATRKREKEIEQMEMKQEWQREKAQSKKRHIDIANKEAVYNYAEWGLRFDEAKQ